MKIDEKIKSELTLVEIASFYVLNLCSVKDLVDFAYKALEKNIVSISFSILAGEINPTMDFAADLFEQGLADCSIAKPNTFQAQLNVAQCYARAIKDGRLSPYKGAYKIWWEISNEIENPSEILLSFVGAASEIEDLYERYKNDNYDPSLHIKEYEKKIIVAANLLLKIVDPSKLYQK